MSATVTVNTEPLDALMSQVRGLADIDFSPLMEEWRTVLEEDNVEGALAGLNGFGDPLEPVTYRPDPNAGSRKPIDFSIQPNDNLTSGHYRTLDGPPLAPQGLESRIVTHFRTQSLHPGLGEWVVEGAWEDVLSVDGEPFLQAHFRGENNLPVRDLAHVRPSALQRARDMLQGIVTRILQQQFKGSA